VVALYAVNLAFVALLGLCAANVATLVFGRTVTREAEITVRTALGASRIRVVAQLVAEAFVLVSIAAGVGLAGASVALRWVRRAWETGQGSAMPFWWNERIDAETLLYTAALAVAAALIVGGVPAVKATGREIQGRLKDAGAGSTMKFGRLWTCVIVMQVAITVVFLLSVVSLAWSIVTIERQYENVAFERGNYLTAWFAPNSDVGPGDPAVTFHQRQEFLARLMDTAAVATASYTTRLPGADQESSYFEVNGTAATVRAAHSSRPAADTSGSTSPRARPPGSMWRVSNPPTSPRSPAAPTGGSCWAVPTAPCTR